MTNLTTFLRSSELIAACDRLLETEREIMEMPQEERKWFMGKAGHKDCFVVARALKELLQSPEAAEMRKFNNDPEWLRRKADAEDGCDVGVGGSLKAE
jgi:hypothetical protein